MLCVYHVQCKSIISANQMWFNLLKRKGFNEFDVNRLARRICCGRLVIEGTVAK